MDFLNRFKEPSSWAGISALLLIFGVPVGIGDALVQVVAGITAAAAIIMREKAKP